MRSGCRNGDDGGGRINKPELGMVCCDLKLHVLAVEFKILRMAVGLKDPQHF